MSRLERGLAGMFGGLQTGFRDYFAEKSAEQKEKKRLWTDLVMRGTPPEIATNITGYDPSEKEQAGGGDIQRLLQEEASRKESEKYIPVSGGVKEKFKPVSGEETPFPMGPSSMLKEDIDYYNKLLPEEPKEKIGEAAWRAENPGKTTEDYEEAMGKIKQKYATPPSILRMGLTKEELESYKRKISTPSGEIKEQDAWEMYQEKGELRRLPEPRLPEQSERLQYLEEKLRVKTSELLRKTKWELSQEDVAFLKSQGYEWKGEDVPGGVEQGDWEKKTTGTKGFSANQDEIDYINAKAKNEEEARAWLRKKGYSETEINIIIKNTAFGM